MKPYYSQSRPDGLVDIHLRYYRSDDYGPSKDGPFTHDAAEKRMEQLKQSFAWGEADDWAGWKQ